MTLLKGQEDSTAHFVSIKGGKVFSTEYLKLELTFDELSIYPLVNSEWNDFAFRELQNLMRVSNPLLYKAEFETKSISGLSAHEEFRMCRESVRYYHTNSPYTNVRFLTAYNNGLSVGILHSQNIHPRWNVAIDFLKGGSEGFFEREEQKYDRLVLSTIGHGKGGKYEFKLFAFLNSQRGEENGGVSSDTSFIQNEITDRSVIPVNLQTATVSFKQVSFGLDQSILLCGSRLDSVGISRVDGGENISGFGHSFYFLQEAFGYRDTAPLSGYYDNIFRDSINTQDTSYYKNLENNLAYFVKNERLNLEVGASYELIFWNYGFNSNFDQRSRVFADLFFSFPFADLELESDYVLLGLGSSSGFVNAKISKRIRDGKTLIFAQGGVRRDFQSLMLREYFGNHMKWDNVDVPMNVIGNFEAGLRTSNDWARVGLVFGHDNQSARGFLTTTEGPKFLNVSSLYADLELMIKLGVFVFDNRVYLNETNAPLPSLIARHAIYYESYWFSKAMNIRIGVKANYTDNYISQAFSPSIGHFVLQEESPTDISFYPYLDFFVNFKVRTFELYFAVQHISQGFFGYNYFAVPHYTLPERALRLGVNWQFSN
jgi:hypothetical protein